LNIIAFKLHFQENPGLWDRNTKSWCRWTL